MATYSVVYQQREVRSFCFEADSDEAARAYVHRLVDKDGLPAGSFDHADEQEVLYVDRLSDGVDPGNPAVWEEE